MNFSGEPLYSEVQVEQLWTCLWDQGWGWWWICPYTEGAGARRSLYCEIQCIVDNGHMGLPYGQNDRQTRLKTLHSRTSLIINYCCYRDNGDFTQWNRPSLNVCCNSWCSWSNRSVFCRSVFVPATYHQVHILAPHILWKEQLEYLNNSHNGIVTPIWVFPNCFHWIQRIQWQKYLSLQ